MAFILKVVDSHDSPVEADNAYRLYSDITAVRFARLGNALAIAHCDVREPIKTAEVPGFRDVEKNIEFTGVAYVMNENGKTVSMFTAQTSGENPAKVAA